MQLLENFLATHGAETIFDEEELLVLRQDCHHHLRNVWIGAIHKTLSKWLSN